MSDGSGGGERAIVSDIDLVVLVVHSNGSDLSPPPGDEELRDRAEGSS